MPDAEKSRPQFRNIHITQLSQYRLPLAGYVSILHRISGLFIFLMLPFILCLFDKSLVSASTFDTMLECVRHPFIKLILLALSWGYLHHFCAGLRHLAMDLHIGLDKHSAGNSAVAVFAVSLSLTALIGLKLFGVF